MARLKLGIIGCGGIANGKHLPSLKAIDRADIVAFCDLVVERAEKAAKEYGVPGAKVYTDYHELLKDESIDVVYVLTPNRSHADISIDALNAGKHVMCEKPMAKCAADARRMVEAAKKSGKKLTIGYQHRQKAESQYVKACIERGDLGEIYYAKAYAIRRRGTPNWGVFLNEYEQGGGPLIDIGTHSLDFNRARPQPPGRHATSVQRGHRMHKRSAERAAYPRHSHARSHNRRGGKSNQPAAKRLDSKTNVVETGRIYVSQSAMAGGMNIRHSNAQSLRRKRESA